MRNKKIDKDTIEKKNKNLFYKDLFKGFQFTAGRTPLGIKNNDKYDLGISLNFNEGKSSSVIDGSEFRLEEKLFSFIFPDCNNNQKYVDLDYLNKLKITFQDLGYEYETAKFAGEWFWFRVKCKLEDIEENLKIIKENIK